jgi:hypothetical protein
MKPMQPLTIHYEGYWQCRQATDPDPSTDPRGASGYTFAVGYENDLDQIIRLQRDEIPDCDFRDAPEPFYPPGHATKEFGVFVTDVTLGGKSFPKAAKALRKGKIRWLPHGEPELGPKFELRNTITYAPVTDAISMPIVPFEIQVESPDREIILRRDDPLDPQHPDRKIWQIADYKVYARRCPANWFDNSDEAMTAVGVSLDGANNFAAYFQKRKEWLQLELAEETDPVRREAINNRLYVINFFSSKADNRRLLDRLGLNAVWDFALKGRKISVTGEKQLGGRVRKGGDWGVRFWMGAFDGDLMRGYMRGTLTVPFEKT